MTWYKKIFLYFIVFSLMLPAGIVIAANDEYVIELSDDTILVNGSTISEDADEAVYLTTRVETHEDVTEDLKDVENKVVTIAEAGTYHFSGTITDAQIAVRAEDTDEVTLILDQVDITCRTAPAILIYSANEPAQVGEAGVTLYLAEDSVNQISGSHTLATEDDDIKHDAAISSNVSLKIDGTGTLDVVSDNEGIEVKYKHLTIENGTIQVDGMDDPINVSEDGVGHLTINGGTVYCITNRGTEGDGMDSNGYITINGGTVIALANPQSMDSGLDSDMGTVINGGTVIGAGNMYDPIENSDEQLFMCLQFSESTDDIICITDTEKNPIIAYDFPENYTYISISTPKLTEGTYHAYIDGTAEGDDLYGLYTDFTYTGGEQLHHGGTMQNENAGMGMDGMPPQDFAGERNGEERPQINPDERVQGELEEGQQPPQRPEGMQEPPQGGGGFGGGRGQLESSSETITYDFQLTADTQIFTNVSTQESSLFQDVQEGDWFYEVVQQAVQKGYIVGNGDGTFAPYNSVTGAEWLAILSRIDGISLSDEGDPWYAEVLSWGEESGLLDALSWTLAPEEPLTREQMAEFIYYFAQINGVDMSSQAELSMFVDEADISEAAYTAVSWAVASGILEGDGTMFYPKDNLSRAEAAKVAVVLQSVMESSSQQTATVYSIAVDSSLYTAFAESTEDYFSDGFKTGFGSGLTFKGYDEEGNPQFYGITDRGPSLDLPLEDGTVSDSTKIFPAPDFTPSIGIITIKDGEAVVEDAITLKDEDGAELSGLPLPEGTVGATGEQAVDVYLQELEGTLSGFDPEGIAVDADGNFWVADEYGPFIAKFSADGTMLEKYAPGDGLPEILQYRIANRGFEGITVSPSGKIFATLQSVLDIDGETSGTATFIRIVMLDPETGETKMYGYPVETSDYKTPKNCKIGDVYAIDDQTLLLVEQGTLADGSARNIVYKVDLTNATDLTDLTYNEQELEYTDSTEELLSVMQYAEKEEYVDLRALGFTAEKAEGLCMLDDGTTLAVITEDDFGLAGAELTEDGSMVTLLPNSEADAAQLWLIQPDINS